MLRRLSFLRCASSAKAAAEKTKFEEQYASMGTNLQGKKATEKTSISVVMDRSKCGALLEILQVFKNEGLNLDYIASREMPLNADFDKITMFFDWGLHESHEKSQRAIAWIKKTQYHMQVIGSYRIPPFACNEMELDMLEQKTLAAGAELQDDPENPHPGFHDEEYKRRRREICEQGIKYRFGKPVDYLEYTQTENDTWAAIWDKLIDLYPTHACRQCNENMQLLIERAGYSRKAIPQLRDINNFLLPRTGFNIRPVAGLLSARDFFNGLALRTFYSTQYIRHHSRPLYTPEPDVVHELMGHVPLFADKDFADFSQTIGLASLGAPDDVVEQLARCYWYSVEFGLARDNGKLRAYGAGLLSSFGELQYCLTPEPKVLNWDPSDAAKREFPITKYQPIYYVADSFKDAQYKMKDFIDGLDLPHRVEYNMASRTILTYAKTAVITS